jgi:hypothetical protein
MKKAFSKLAHGSSRKEKKTELQETASRSSKTEPSPDVGHSLEKENASSDILPVSNCGNPFLHHPKLTSRNSISFLESPREFSAGCRKVEDQLRNIR